MLIGRDRELVPSDEVKKELVDMETNFFNAVKIDDPKIFFIIKDGEDGEKNKLKREEWEKNIKSDLNKAMERDDAKNILAIVLKAYIKSCSQPPLLSSIYKLQHGDASDEDINKNYDILKKIFGKIDEVGGLNGALSDMLERFKNAISVDVCNVKFSFPDNLKITDVNGIFNNNNKVEISNEETVQIKKSTSISFKVVVGENREIASVKFDDTNIQKNINELYTCNVIKDGTVRITDRAKANNQLNQPPRAENVEVTFSSLGNNETYKVTDIKINGAAAGDISVNSDAAGKLPVKKDSKLEFKIEGSTDIKLGGNTIKPGNDSVYSIEKIENNIEITVTLKGTFAPPPPPPPPQGNVILKFQPINNIIYKVHFVNVNDNLRNQEVEISQNEGEVTVEEGANCNISVTVNGQARNILKFEVDGKILNPVDFNIVRGNENGLVAKVELAEEQVEDGNKGINQDEDNNENGNKEDQLGKGIFFQGSAECDYKVYEINGEVDDTVVSIHKKPLRVKKGQKINIYNGDEQFEVISFKISSNFVDSGYEFDKDGVNKKDFKVKLNSDGGFYEIAYKVSGDKESIQIPQLAFKKTKYAIIFDEGNHLNWAKEDFKEGKKISIRKTSENVIVKAKLSDDALKGYFKAETSNGTEISEVSELIADKPVEIVFTPRMMPKNKMKVECEFYVFNPEDKENALRREKLYLTIINNQVEEISRNVSEAEENPDVKSLIQIAKAAKDDFKSVNTLDGLFNKYKELTEKLCEKEEYDLYVKLPPLKEAMKAITFIKLAAPRKHFVEKVGYAYMNKEGIEKNINFMLKNYLLKGKHWDALGLDLFKSGLLGKHLISSSNIFIIFDYYVEIMVTSLQVRVSNGRLEGLFEIIKKSIRRRRAIIAPLADFAKDIEKKSFSNAWTWAMNRMNNVKLNVIEKIDEINDSEEVKAAKRKINENLDIKQSIQIDNAANKLFQINNSGLIKGKGTFAGRRIQRNLAKMDQKGTLISGGAQDKGNNKRIDFREGIGRLDDNTIALLGRATIMAQTLLKYDMLKEKNQIDFCKNVIKKLVPSMAAAKKSANALIKLCKYEKEGDIAIVVYCLIMCGMPKIIGQNSVYCASSDEQRKGMKRVKEKLEKIPEFVKNCTMPQGDTLKEYFEIKKQLRKSLKMIKNVQTPGLPNGDMKKITKASTLNEISDIIIRLSNNNSIKKSLRNLIQAFEILNNIIGGGMTVSGGETIISLFDGFMVIGVRYGYPWDQKITLEPISARAERAMKKINEVTPSPKKKAVSEENTVPK